MALYPTSLPVPASIRVMPADRRQASLLEARPIQRDRNETATVQFPPMAADQAAAFRAWFDTQLADGAAWFVASWPTAEGAVARGYRFVGTPAWQFVPGGFWSVSATLEMRGAGTVEAGSPVLLVNEIALPGKSATNDRRAGYRLKGGFTAADTIRLRKINATYSGWNYDNDEPLWTNAFRVADAAGSPAVDFLPATYATLGEAAAADLSTDCEVTGSAEYLVYLDDGYIEDNEGGLSLRAWRITP